MTPWMTLLKTLLNTDDPPLLLSGWIFIKSHVTPWQCPCCKRKHKNCFKSINNLRWWIYSAILCNDICMTNNIPELLNHLSWILLHGKSFTEKQGSTIARYFIKSFFTAFRVHWFWQGNQTNFASGFERFLWPASETNKRNCTLPVSQMDTRKCLECLDCWRQITIAWKA